MGCGENHFEGEKEFCAAKKLVLGREKSVGCVETFLGGSQKGGICHLGKNPVCGLRASIREDFIAHNFCTGLAVQCLSVGVGVKHASERLSEVEGVVANFSKHGQSLAKDVNEKVRRPRQAEGGDHSSGDPLDWLRASVPGEPGQDYPILSAIQVIVVIITMITIIKTFPGGSQLRITNANVSIIIFIITRRRAFHALTEYQGVTMQIQSNDVKPIMSVCRSKEYHHRENHCL